MNNSYLNNKLIRVKLAFDSISVYRGLLEDKVLTKLYLLTEYLEIGKFDLGSFTKLYSDFFYSLCCSSYNSLKDYIIELILFDENPYSLSCESNKMNQNETYLHKVAANDLNNLQIIANLSSSELKVQALEYCEDNIIASEIINNLPDYNINLNSLMNNTSVSTEYYEVKNHFYYCKKWSECISYLSEYYKNNGCGLFGRYKAFVWEYSGNIGKLTGINTPDTVCLSNFIGYEAERSKIIENTIQFLHGFKANNILLYGDRGTGKSSTVKALLNEYYKKGLRIIEVPKAHLSDFPSIIRLIKNRPQKFIIFIDDLSFQENDESYTTLKAVLEGGIEGKPNNVLIYATSNRRHLVKEKFHERNGLTSVNNDEEIHATDTIQEKLSLADRFGITVVFSSPDKSQYLKIVEGLAAQRNISIDKEKLHREALKWELWYNGRSPRTARQFIDWLEGCEKLNK
ncbi:ATP-binding protein [Clostridium sp. SYSU_GA19001]|uniref:ATP-binding protein n=1 Tax=Clostridium caldaquaticum TaxID=2940653 RepID=UPI00207798E1|nr:ATP-binding protein [Clostridium caldaquaticum]MCM8710911.1 ATP-binding protein [Clostridium caldaquaticum]